MAASIAVMDVHPSLAQIDMLAQIDPPFKILFDIDFHEVAFGMPVHDITYHDPTEEVCDKFVNEFPFFLIGRHATPHALHIMDKISFGICSKKSPRDKKDHKPGRPEQETP